jgi:hypothetical protein
LIVGIIALYPLQLFVVTDICEEWFFDYSLHKQQQQQQQFQKGREYWKQNALRTLIVTITVAIGIGIPNFGTHTYLLSLIFFHFQSSIELLEIY